MGWWAWLAAVGAFALVSHLLLDRQAKQMVLEHVRLCAASLTPAAGGALTPAVDRLRAAYPALLAIGLLDTQGDVRTVYPEGGTYRTAMQALAGAHGQPRLLSVRAHGQTVPAGGAVVPLTGVHEAAARRVAVLVRVPAFAESWYLALTVFGLVMVIVLQYGAGTLTRWFERGVSRPLRRLASAVTESPVDGAVFPPDACGELQQIALEVNDLVRELTSARSRAARVQRDAEWKLKESEAGFDRQLRRAREEATVDSLTRLRNRAFLERELEGIFAAQQVRGDDLAAMMIDVDYFKQLNDACGHKAGDDVLRFMGELLRGATRPSDVAIRYGGDEFLILLPGTSQTQAQAVAERVVRLFAQYAATLAGGVPLSLSAGVASLRQHQPASGSDLVHAADEALYLAKRDGKNGVGAEQLR